MEKLSILVLPYYPLFPGFEYPMFVTHKGDFSNGITTIQCMYAPEFTSHSEGVRVKVVE